MDTRIKSLDMARGIGIFLVVLGHSVVTPLREEYRAYQALYDGIYLFHMSFFFFLSGFLMEASSSGNCGKAGNRKQTLKKKAQQLLIPYFFYSVLGYGTLGIVSGRSIGQCIVEILTTENHIFHHLWFLYTMFVVYALSLMISGKYIVWALGIMAVLHGFFSAISGLPLILLYIVRYTFFFQAGRLWRIRMAKRSRFLIWTNAAVFVLMELLYIYIFASPAAVTGIWHVTERFACSLVILGGGITGSFLLLDISQKLEAGGKGAFLTRLGKNSMEIYVLHMPLLVPGAGNLLWKAGLNGIVILGICTVIGIEIPLLLSKIIYRSDKLSLIVFGRSKK
ncbi:MAG: acyltransferase [Eubacteriales bacterium]|nr:acyltransferase [Eubacteriales bacterium]